MGGFFSTGDQGIGNIYYEKESSKIEKLRRESREDLEFRYHYHGYIVRRLMMAGAFIMIMALPLVYEYIGQGHIPLPFATATFSAIIFAIIAGLTSPRKFTIISDLLINIGAVAVFEYFAIHAQEIGALFFMIANQVLVGIFIMASYYSIKTLRGFWPSLN